MGDYKLIIFDDSYDELHRQVLYDKNIDDVEALARKLQDFYMAKQCEILDYFTEKTVYCI